MRRIALLLCLLLPRPLLSAEPVDLELVLAVDTSRSMDREEQEIQREGYATALTDPAVLSAIMSGPGQRIVIAYLEWGGPENHQVVLGWTEIRSAADAERAAQVLRAQPFQTSRGTSISSGLAAAAAMIEQNAYDGVRRVIDVSGDGPNNLGGPVDAMRDVLVERGFEINGLPVMLRPGGGPFSIAELDLYYEDCVIGGPAAFVVPVRRPEEFAPAIRRKLVLEITGIAPEPRLRPVALTDCQIGEKLRRRWLEMDGGG